MPWYDDRFFPPSLPRPAKGGIRAHSKRGAFARSWWAQRWITALESLNLGGRLARGRSYARRGQVLDIAVERALVQARVQGSRPDPYAVTIRIPALSSEQWRRLVASLRHEARYAAKLLAGEMPPDIEQAFTAASLSLFPARSRDLMTECSCPDWSNPCKHIAAVYYLLGEEFDRDPFLIFRLRGLERADLLQLLGPGAGPLASPGRREAAPEEPAAAAAMEPLAADPETFWSSGEPPVDFFGAAAPPPTHAAVARRLGAFPFWRGRQGLLDALEPMYARASARGVEVVAGLGPSGRRQTPG